MLLHAGLFIFLLLARTKGVEGIPLASLARIGRMIVTKIENLQNLNVCNEWTG